MAVFFLQALLAPHASVGVLNTACFHGHSHAIATQSPWLCCTPSCPLKTLFALLTSLWFPLCGSPGRASECSALLHPPYSRASFRFFSLPFFFFLPCVHIMCVCVKVVFSKTSLFIDDVIVIVLFFWLINCLLSLLCMPAKISHTSSWKGYEETSN